VPAVNNHGAFGTWAFVEITDPWNAQAEIRAGAWAAAATAVEK
jgi:type III restriction enzyme